jgi:ActR/RegA family two-component response regulator
MSKLTMPESTKDVGPTSASHSGEQPCVLIVEDNYLLASTLVDVLAELGYTPVDCEGSFIGAMAAAETATYEFAVVELHLKGESALPILDTLMLRGIPYILATCAERADISPIYSSAPFISKPYDVEQLRKAIIECIEG